MVLLTAKTGIDNELKGLRKGADAYITKPFNDEKVLLTVKNILDNQKRFSFSLKAKNRKRIENQLLIPSIKN